MKIGQLLTYFLILSICYGKLKIVGEIYRHGARGSLSNYYDGQDQSEISGELTATGQRQHYTLGQFLRQEYIEQLQFMPEHYNHSLIYVRADDFNRTIMSAYSHFQGFYPVGTGNLLPSNLTFNYTLPPYRSPYVDINTTKDLGFNALPYGIQVLPVHVISRETDLIFLAGDICPNISQYESQYKSQISEQERLNFVNTQMQETMQILSQTFNTTFTNVYQVNSLIDVLYADNSNGRYVPYLTPQIWQNLSFIYDFVAFYQSKQTIKTVTQPQLQELFNYFSAILSGQSSLKWLSYSGHDTNVAPLLQAMNLTSVDCIMDNFFNNTTTNEQKYLNCAHGPTFASHILIEVYEDDHVKLQPEDDQYDNLFVRVRYNGEYMKLCERNQTVCSYNEYSNRIISAFAQNYTELCGTTVQSQLKSDNINQYQSLYNIESKDESSYSMIVLTFIIAQTALLIFVGQKAYQWKNQLNHIQSNIYTQNLISQ